MTVGARTDRTSVDAKAGRRDGKGDERRRGRRILLPVLLLFLAATAPDPILAQSSGLPGGICADGGDLCLSAIEGARALRSDLSLSTTGGGAFAGPPSTLGRRLPGAFRLGFSLSATGVRSAAPTFHSSGMPAEIRSGSGTISSLRGGMALGLFHGFSPAPTVGGILAVDALAGGAFLSSPSSLQLVETGFGWSAGVRVGILRESFSLPGVSFSVQRVGGGTVRTGEDESSADPSLPRIELVPAGWSSRLAIGKEIGGFGVQGGLGWDRGTGRIRVRSGPGIPGVEGDFVTNRSLYFVGATWTHLVFQFSAEAGWAGGRDPLGPGPVRGIDPGRRSAFGGLSARITW